MAKRQKYGGRTKGTPNAITSDLRAFLFDVVSNNLQSDLMSLEPRKRAELLIRCLPYILPSYPDAAATDVEPLTLVLTRETCARCESI